MLCYDGNCDRLYPNKQEQHEYSSCCHAEVNKGYICVFLIIFLPLHYSTWLPRGTELSLTSATSQIPAAPIKLQYNSIKCCCWKNPTKLKHELPRVMETLVYIGTVILWKALVTEGYPGNYITRGGKLILSNVVSPRTAGWIWYRAVIAFPRGPMWSRRRVEGLFYF